MTLNGEQLRFCDRVMNELTGNILSEPFRTPVDIVALGIPDYPKYVKKPMDLGTISKKLGNNEYKSVSEWKSDVELVWDNAIQFNMIDSPVGIMALHMRDLFREMTKNFTGNETLDRMMAIKNTISDIKALFDKAPYSMEVAEPIVEVDEADEPVLSPIVKKAPRKPKPSKSSVKEPKISISSKNKKKSSSKVSRVEKPEVYEEVAFVAPETEVVPEPVQEEEPVPEPVHEPQVEETPKEAENSKQTVSDDLVIDSELLRVITDSVNNLTNDYDIERVADLIQTMEGGSSVEEEVEIEKLQPQTIKALKQLLDSFR